jgi:hypothetical protein
MTVRLRRFTDPGLFLEHCSACLATHEAENNLPLGILANLLAGQYKEFPPYMAAVECDRSIVQVLLRIPPHPLLISYRDTPPSDEVVRLVVEDLRREYGDELAGMTGDKDVVSSYVKAWEHTSARQARLRTAMRVYRASQIRPIMGVLGIMRPITEADGEHTHDRPDLTSPVDTHGGPEARLSGRGVLPGFDVGAHHVLIPRHPGELIAVLTPQVFHYQAHHLIRRRRVPVRN